MKWVEYNTECRLDHNVFFAGSSAMIVIQKHMENWPEMPVLKHIVQAWKNVHFLVSEYELNTNVYTNPLVFNSIVNLQRQVTSEISCRKQRKKWLRTEKVDEYILIWYSAAAVLAALEFLLGFPTHYYEAGTTMRQVFTDRDGKSYVQLFSQPF